MIGIKSNFVSKSQISYKVSSRRNNNKKNHRIQAKADTKIPLQYKTIKPKGDYILVKAAPEETKTTGGILLPSTATQKPTTGIVEVLGDGKLESGKKKKFILKTGESVLYSKMGFMYSEIEFKNENYILIQENEILGTFKKQNPSGEDISELQPLHDNVLVKVIEESDVTVGGVMLPDTIKERPVVGIVVKSGPGKEKDDKFVPCKVKKGDKIVYFKYAGDDLETPSGQKFKLLKDNDVLCKL